MAQNPRSAIVDFGAARFRRIREWPAHLDAGSARPYSPAMINAATILVTSRRRTNAVWADVCV
jgi:hypothetical protein